MKISFQTKEESNQQQREDFLKLSPVERFYAFLDLSQAISRFPQKKEFRDKKNNFTLTKHERVPVEKNIHSFLELAPWDKLCVQ